MHLEPRLNLALLAVIEVPPQVQGVTQKCKISRGVLPPVANGGLDLGRMGRRR